MPELPDVTLYIDRLTQKLAGQTLDAVRVQSPFLLRTAVPPLSSALGRATCASPSPVVGA